VTRYEPEALQAPPATPGRESGEDAVASAQAIDRNG